MKSRILVTGGSRGIGAAVVARFAAEARDLVVISRGSNLSAEEAMARRVKEVGGSVRFWNFDLSSSEQVVRAVAAIKDDQATNGPFAIAVMNAGFNVLRSATHATLTDIEAILRGNMGSVVAMLAPVLGGMRRARSGRVVLVGSIAAHRGAPGNALYAATKAALEGYCFSIASEVARYGIRVNCVAPGFIDTDMMIGSAVNVAAIVPCGRLGTPDEVAAAIQFLASPDASFINGSVLTVDGGVATSVMTSFATPGCDGRALARP